MKTIINENPDIKVTVEIDDEKVQYLGIIGKKYLNEKIKDFYDEVNYNICHADPNNNIPIEQALKQKDRGAKLKLAKMLFFDSTNNSNEAIETKVNGKYMSFNHDDCVVAIYKDEDVPNMVRNAIGVLYKEKLFGKLQIDFNAIKQMNKHRSIVSLIEDACEEYWDEQNIGKATFMISALKSINDFDSLNVALVAIDFVKDDFDNKNDPEMVRVLKDTEGELFSKMSNFGSSVIEVRNTNNCKCSITLNGIDSNDHIVKFDKSSCEVNKEDDDEEFL